MSDNPFIAGLMDTNKIRSIPLDLPSRGVFYLNNEVSGQTSLSVAPVGVLDETMLQDPLMVFTGSSVTSMVPKVCPEVVDAEHICGIDVSAILIASRIASRGKEQTISGKCSKCEEGVEFSLDLVSHLSHYSPIPDELLESLKVTLPISKQTVQMRFPLYKDQINLMLKTDGFQSRAKDALSGINLHDGVSEDDADKLSNVIDQTIDLAQQSTSAFILSITTADGSATTSDREVIDEWVPHLLAEDVEALNGATQRISDYLTALDVVEFECPHCKHLNKMEVILDPTVLFTDAGASKPTKSTKTPSTATKGKGKNRSMTRRS